MMFPPVTVVVASYGKVATLRACLDAVLATDYPDLDVLVVDSGSTDGTLDLLREHYPRLRVELAPGASLAAALNRGFARAGTRDVVRLHGDVAPQGRDWLRRLATAAHTLPRAGVVGVKLVHANGRIQSLGRDLITGLGFGHQNTDRRAFELDSGAGGEPIEVDGVRGACAYYRRDVLRCAQLDEAYAPAHGDDDDFCIAARASGFKVFVEPSVTAVHYTPHKSRMSQFGGLQLDASLDGALTCADATRQHHFAYFTAKWGFDPTGPDLHEIRRRYGDTEICWRIGAGLRYAVQDPQPAVDVAFVTCNSAHLLPQMLAALRATRWPSLRAFAVDNGSRDETLAILDAAARDFPFPLHVHRLPMNTGVAPAMNLAFSLGAAPLVARLDDDAIVPPDWLERLVPRFAQRPFAGVVVPRVLHGYEGEHLQAAPLRSWPIGLPPRDVERNFVYADVLMRAATLCGCCNLYRRDALTRAGLLDVRYAPTQYDDTDHHIALGNAGFEVLHDGFVSVRHFISQGRAQTYAAVSSSSGNQYKLLGKWGADVSARLDRGIDLSREGRVLPADGDTSGLWRRIAPTPTQRAQPTPLAPAVENALRARAAGFSADGEFTRIGRSLLACAEHALAARALEACSARLWFLIDVFPHWPEVLALQARRAAAEGDMTTARRAMANALALRPNADLGEIVAPPASRRTRAAPVGAVVVTARCHGDAEREALAQVLGPGNAERPAVVVRGFGDDLARVTSAHALDLGDPVRLLDIVKAVRAAAPGAHLRLSPWLPAAEEVAWAEQVLPTVFRRARDGAELERLLAAAALRRLDVDGCSERRRPVARPDWMTRYQREVLGCIDELALFDPAELAPLRAQLGALPPHTVIDWPTPAIPGDLDGEAFARAHDLPDYFLLPGPVVPERNLLVPLYALREHTCVVLGPCPDPEYLALCQRFAGPRSRFIAQPGLEQLPTAIAGAVAVVHVDFADRVTTALAWARALGRRVWCSPAGQAARQLGALAIPIDPCDVPRLRAAAEASLAMRA